MYLYSTHLSNPSFVSSAPYLPKQCSLKPDGSGGPWQHIFGTELRHRCPNVHIPVVFPQLKLCWHCYLQKLWVFDDVNICDSCESVVIFRILSHHKHPCNSSEISRVLAGFTYAASYCHLCVANPFHWILPCKLILHFLCKNTIDVLNVTWVNMLWFIAANLGAKWTNMS